jgi:asparagine synthase (glutamine-hydrolysing)
VTNRLLRSEANVTAICGWAGLEHPPKEAEAILERMGGAAPGRSDTVRLIARAGAGSGSRADSFTEGDASVIVVGRPRWRGSSPSSSPGIARHILDGYRASGVDVLKSLSGAFALALTADAGRTALLAVDRMGIASLTYRPADGGVIFGSSSGPINRYFEAAQEIDRQSLFNYFFLHMVPGPSTIFRDQYRIPPGGFVQLKDGELSSGKYWQMRYDEPSSYRLDALKEEFRELLERSVSDLVSGDAVGTFLSGGTDSSTVTGLLQRISDRPIRSYSIGFKAEGYDEIEYARIAARHFATEHREYYVTPDDVVTLAPLMAAFCDQPFGNASAVPTYYCAHLAKSDGIELLLGGDGGDELFGGNERYATQSVYSWYERVPVAFRRGLIEPLLFGVPGAERVALLRKGRGYVTKTRESVPRRLHAYNMLRRIPPGTVFTAEFLAEVDPETPLELLERVYHEADAANSLNRMLAMDLQFTLADNDLYKVNRMCELAGIDVAYPMLNDDLVAFSARLPEELKLRGMRLRYFFKEALKDFLPDEIIKKRKHGFGLPIGIWMQTHEPLRALVYDAVHALGTRGIVRPAFVDRVISEHRAGHAAYWGGEIWVLSQFELWLRAHGFAAGRPLA